MVDVNKVSQSVLNKIGEIGQMDGKKGITSQAECDKLKDYLASGEISGSINEEYIQNLISKYELDEAQQAASKDVIKVIDKAMKLAGEKNEIDDSRELAVLDEIIDNVDGKYSDEDVKYAQLMKSSAGYNAASPLQMANEDVQQLTKQLQEYQEKVQELMTQLDQKEIEIEKQMAHIESLQPDESKQKSQPNLGNVAEHEKLKKQSRKIKDLKTNGKNIMKALSAAVTDGGIESAVKRETTICEAIQNWFNSVRGAVGTARFANEIVLTPVKHLARPASAITLKVKRN
jgi:type IV secretory pathway VirB10-like protein